MGEVVEFARPGQPAAKAPKRAVRKRKAAAANTPLSDVEQPSDAFLDEVWGEWRPNPAPGEPEERWTSRASWESVELPPNVSPANRERMLRVRTAFFDAVSDGDLVRVCDVRFLLRWMTDVVERWI